MAKQETKAESTGMKIPIFGIVIALVAVAALAGTFILMPGPAPKDNSGGTGADQNQDNGSANDIVVPVERAIVAETRNLLFQAKSEYDAAPESGAIIKVSLKSYQLNKSEIITLQEITKNTTFDPSKISIMCPVGMDCSAALGTITATTFISVKIQATCNYAGCSLRYMVP